MRKLRCRLGIFHQIFQRAFALRVALGIDIYLTSSLHIGLTSQYEDLEFGLSGEHQQQAEKCDKRFGFHKARAYGTVVKRQATAF